MGKRARPTGKFMWFGLVLLLGLAMGCVCLIGSLRVVFSDPPKDVGGPQSKQEYSFDADTIQEAIVMGQQNIFQLEWEWDYQPRTSEPIPTSLKPLLDFSPIPWHEADFDRVVRASVELLGKEPLVGVAPFSISFFTPCRHTDIGFQRISFGFFQVIQSKLSGQKLYLIRHADVNLATERLNWSEEILSAIGYDRPALDVTHIPAEQALQIAESIGGASLRAQAGNACDISGRLVTTGNLSNKWRVEYQRESSFRSLLEVQIDAKSGEAELVVTSVP